MLNEDMFKKRVPNSGDILYQALQNLIPKVTYKFSKNLIIIIKKIFNENKF